MGLFLILEAVQQSTFLKQYEQLKQNNIRFVVASGNQLAKLVTYFQKLIMRLLLLPKMVLML